jgi:asparagine synthase (glutamine-hydrolysing)
MVSRDGRWIIAFNGEIYNHASLRMDLPGPWRGSSDTETLVEAIARWGVTASVKRCVGMFAVAAWDTHERTLWLFRDRLGEKPLYYGVIAGQFRAASELKALLVGVPRPEPNRNAIAAFLRHNCIPAPLTIWSGLSKLRPGHLLAVRQNDWNTPPPSTAWWSISDHAAAPSFAGSDADAITRLDHLLRESVRGQMMSDVPLGAFLSGGIDSSLIAGMMQSLTPRPIRTFTIGFEETEFDESGHAEAVARHLGTDHTTMRVTAAEAQRTIPDLPRIWDEPFADSSQIPTLLLSRLTRRHVTVSLSGDGGDELFAGYQRYADFARLRRMQTCIPRPLRHLAASAITSLPTSAWDAAAKPFWWWSPGGTGAVGDKAHKLAGILTAVGSAELYQRIIGHWARPELMVIGATTPLDPSREYEIDPSIDPLSRIQFADQTNYLPDDILVKVDRAAMSASLETRVPMLDHRVVEFSWTLPTHLKVRHGHGKWILRQILDRYVPRQLIDRPKMGFGIPLAAWLRGPLREWAEELLSESRLRNEGFLNPSPIRRKWIEHLSGRRNWHYHLWDILMFQAWLEHWRKNEA